MFVNEVRRSSDPRSERLPSRQTLTVVFPSPADGDHRRRVGSADEDAAPHRHAGVKLPRFHRGHGHHPAARARRALLPKPPEEGKRRCGAAAAAAVVERTNVGVRVPHTHVELAHVS